MIPRAKPIILPYQSHAVHELIGAGIAILGVSLQCYAKFSPRENEVTPRDLATALSAPQDPQAELKKLASRPPQHDKVGMTGLALLLAGSAYYGYIKIRRGRYLDQQEIESRNPDTIRGCLFVLHHVLINKLSVLPDTKNGTVRITVYGVVPSPTGDLTELEQAIDYVGCDRQDTAGRRFPISVGIIGKAARASVICQAYREASPEKTEDYHKELVQKWGFTMEQAKKMRADRRSFYARPIFAKDGKEVSGVLYADSSVDKAFDNHLDLFDAAVGGIVEYLSERSRHD